MTESSIRPWESHMNMQNLQNNYNYKLIKIPIMDSLSNSLVRGVATPICNLQGSSRQGGKHYLDWTELDSGEVCTALSNKSLGKAKRGSK